MKKQKLLKNLRHRLSLLLCLMAFLAVGQSAWGEKLYLLHGTANDQYASYTSIAEDDNGSTFVFELSGWDHFIYLCKTNTYGSGNVITPLEGNHYKKGSGIQTFQRTNYSTFYMMYIKPDNGNITQTYTLTYNSSNGDYNLSIGGPTPGACTYWMKHPWNGGEWTYKELTSDGEGGYTITDLYGSGGCNINKINSGTGEVYFNPKDDEITVVGNPSSGDECIFRYVPGTSDCNVKDYGYGGRVTITKKTSATAPTVRLGNKPEENMSTYNVAVSAYVAATGCANIEEFTVYYSKSSISSTSGSGVYKKEFPQSPAPALGSTTTLTLPSADLATNGWSTGGDLYIRITGTNSAGESVLSDEIKLNYTTCQGIITYVNIVPSSKSVAVGEEITFSYTTNPDAEVTETKWYLNEATEPTATTTTYTYTPTAAGEFTMDLKVYSDCNPDGVSAEQQTYTACDHIGTLSISNCPDDIRPVGTPITLTANLTGTQNATDITWVINDAEQQVDQDTKTSVMTFTPSEVRKYVIEVIANGCAGDQKVANCNVDVRGSYVGHDVENLEFTACPGKHGFIFSQMFNPLPDSWSVKDASDNDATSQFTLEDGVMIWKNEGKTAGDYEFTFTATKQGFVDATATLSFTYTAAASTSEVTAITPAEPGETTPWAAVALTATASLGTGETVQWSCDKPALLDVSKSDSKQVTFKAPVVSGETLFTVTAKTQSSSCGTSAGTSVQITVKPDVEICD